jgi:hypothetical protein
MNIYTLLEHLKIRKAMFLGNDYNFKSFDSFISGFTMAASDEQLELDEYPNFGHFSTWLLGHLNKHFGLSGGWHWQITNRNPNNDEKAFAEFFDFLEVFKRSRLHSKSIVIDRDAIEFSKTSAVSRFTVVDGKEQILKERPSKIIWKTIDHSTTVWLDYIEENGTTIFKDHWYINAEEAMNNLALEFSPFAKEWKVNC